MDFLINTHRYVPERDGDVVAYFRNRREEGGNPLFLGSQPYKELLKRGVLEPGISGVRLMWSHGRSDEHFLIDDEGNLEGCDELCAHAGRKGIYTSEEILDAEDAPCWEACSWNPMKLRKA